MKTNRYHFSAHDISELHEALDRPDHTEEENNQDVIMTMIETARDRCRTYYMPATWKARMNNDGTGTVILFHY